MSTIKDIEPEQITNTEDLNIESSTPTTPKVKDPKKVKGGKALARKNEEARKKSSQEESSTNVNVSTIYNGILSMAGLVGAGFTLYQGWKFFERSDWRNDLLRAKSFYGKPKSEEVKEKVEEVKEKLEEVKKSKPVTPLVSPSLRG